MKKILVLITLTMLSVFLFASAFKVTGSCVIKSANGDILREDMIDASSGFLLLTGEDGVALTNDDLIIETSPGSVVHIRESENGVFVHPVDGEVSVKTDKMTAVMISTAVSKVCGLISGEVRVTNTKDIEFVVNNSVYPLILYDDIREKSFTQPSFTSYDFFTETTVEL